MSVADVSFVAEIAASRAFGAPRLRTCRPEGSDPGHVRAGRVARRGGSLVLVTHDRAQADRLAEHFVELDHGRVAVAA